LEQEKFAEAKRQAEILRQRGDEAAAVALEEAARAELGAEKFEALSNEWANKIQTTAADQAEQFQTYANKADASAARGEQYATDIYGKIQDQSKLKQTYGENIFNDATAQAKQKQTYAENIWNDTNKSAIARQEAGQAAQRDIMAAAQGVTRAAEGTDARLTQASARGDELLSTAGQQGQQYLTDAFGNISERYSPFVGSEQRARNQLDAEMGLGGGEVNRDYRNTSAYMAAQDASRVAQEESIAAIDQAAGNSGTLYSGTRGAALSDRAGRGSYERAGIEQSYYQNYMNMLQSMANPAATGAVSGFESNIAGQKAGIGTTTAANRTQLGMTTAGQISDAYMGAAGTVLNAQGQASQMGVNNMRTGMEGADMMNYGRTGLEGSDLLSQMPTGGEGKELLAYLDPGNAGSRDAAMASSLMTSGQGTAASLSLNGMNQGTAGTPYRLQGQDYLTNATTNAAGMITGNMPNGQAGNQLRVAGSDARLNGVSAQNAALADFAGGVGDMATAYMMYGPQQQNQQPAYMYQPQTSYSTPTRWVA